MQQGFAEQEGFIPGCRRDGQTVTPDWTPLQSLIAGVAIREVRNVPKGRGYLTEVFRREWDTGDEPVGQVFQACLAAGEVSAWHAHRSTLDRLFVNRGLARIVLYDARRGSPTFGQVNELRLGEHRPALVRVPPGVWHGVENLADGPSSLLNLPDRAYDYESPDHWRLPWDSELIPFRFEGRKGGVSSHEPG